MRWPLRLQIMLPMSVVMLVLLAGVSVLNAYLSVQRTKLRIQQQLRDVARTLTDSSFPLTDTVLLRMRGLSGADFLLTDQQEGVIAATRVEPAWQAVAGRLRTDAAEISLALPISVSGERYYHAVVQLRRPQISNQPLLLHVLYPEQTYTEALWQAVLPPIIVGGVALLVVMLIGIAVASRVTSPLRQLRTQVQQIAQGDFRAVPLPRRDDEVRDLAVSVNEMAQMLSRYEENVRRNEQLRTVDQLGAGIAHQMRNAATGCRMAMDLHQAECPAGEKSETMEVAKRQLSLMEKYLRRFLTIGRHDPGPAERVDLVGLIDNVLPLVRPAAAHVRVQLVWQPPAGAVQVHGNAEDLEQVIVNLLLNAIEAAAQNSSQKSPARVDIALDHGDHQRVLVQITDSGAGPAPHVRDQIFEPLVTEKPDGTGLGLPVAKEIVDQHGGTISWQRNGNTTRFSISLPRQPPERTYAETAGR